MAIYHNYNNVKFTINNQSILADSANFSINSKLSENQEINKKGGFEYSSDGGAESNVSITYFLTGQDPIKSILDSESAVPLEVAGLTLQKGYLTSYSISASPFGPAKISAAFTFYEDFGGAFSPAILPNADNNYLKFSDMVVTFQGIDTSSKIKSLNYSISRQIEPNYTIDQLTPSSVRFNRTDQSLSMETYNFTEALPYNGKNVTVNFSLGENEYKTSGKMEAKDISFSFASKITSNISVKSNSYGGQPTITSTTPAPATAQQEIRIHGTNLKNATSVYFNSSIKANVYTDRTDSFLGVIVPRFAVNGPVRVVTPYGEVTSPPITINNQIFTP